MPGARQSSDLEAEGLWMTKAGPAIVRCILFLAGEVGRQWDPQLAHIHYRAVANHGKNHIIVSDAVRLQNLRSETRLTNAPRRLPDDFAATK